MKRTKTLDALLGRRVSVTIRKSFPWKKGTVTGKLIWRNGYNIGRQRYIKYNGSRSGRPISEADFETLEKNSEMSRRRAHYA